MDEERSDEVAFTIIRVTAGGILIPHGISELVSGGQSMAALAFSEIGLVPIGATSYVIVFLEMIGATCILVGFFTRAFALALAAEMFWVTLGFFRSNYPLDPQLDYPAWGCPLLLACLMCVVASRGGGRWSLDRLFWGQ
jgi:uncharacterized membrane protein YphA (DoxX/SURF4 family)